MHLALGLDKKSYNLSSDDRDPETLLRFATAQNTQYTCRQGLSSLINFGGISPIEQVYNLYTLRMYFCKGFGSFHRKDLHILN